MLINYMQSVWHGYRVRRTKLSTKVMVIVTYRLTLLDAPGLFKNQMVNIFNLTKFQFCLSVLDAGTVSKKQAVYILSNHI